MIRVIYRWQVNADNFDAFKRAWKEATNHIHATVSGALGSFMLKSFDKEDEVLTIAKWESLEAWQDFWGNENPPAMRQMTTLGTRISVEAFDEVDDYTR